jgi:hypothetical protein
MTNELEAAGARHAEIGYHQMEAAFPEKLDRLRDVGRSEDDVAVRSQIPLENLAGLGAIVDDEDTLSLGFSHFANPTAAQGRGATP